MNLPMRSALGHLNSSLDPKLDPSIDPSTDPRLIYSA